MKKLSRTMPLLALLVLVASLSGAAQTDPLVADAAAEDGVNLRLLLFINEVGLDQEQMEALVGLFQGVLDGRDEFREALEAKGATFNEDMLAFTGTSEELAAAIEAYRAEVARLTEAYEASVSDMIDTLGDTLTYAQGEVFFSAIPQLAPQGFFASARGESQSRMEQLRDVERSAVDSRLRARSSELEPEENVAMNARSRMMQMMAARRPTTVRGRVSVDLLEQIVEVLEQKLDAIR
ncbi:hypothetical protein JW848_07890 [Candidatus Bipolaricaulota bacterium]|nr:hypothetical protein [Candidatus Bipolaricaulota bacterium]